MLFVPTMGRAHFNTYENVMIGVGEMKSLKVNHSHLIKLRPLLLEDYAVVLK